MNTANTFREDSVCEKGKGMGQLNCPRGVTVYNQTANTYIADTNNNCVKVFDSTDEYLFKFGDNAGKGKIYQPLYLHIYTIKTQLISIYMFICIELIEETGRPPGLIFGMRGYFWPDSDKFESWKFFHTFEGVMT